MIYKVFILQYYNGKIVLESISTVPFYKVLHSQVRLIIKRLDLRNKM